MLKTASKVPEVLNRASELARSVLVLQRAGLVSLTRLDEGARALRAVSQLGPVAGAVNIAARRDPWSIALVDERGELSYHQLDRQSNALARAWAARGIGSGTVVAALCRDHRGLVLTMLAIGKLGARLLLMNTGFAGAQLADVARREEVRAMVYDEEFTDLLAGLPEDLEHFLAWVDDDSPLAGSEPAKLDELVVSTDDRPVPVPAQPGGFVLLTSGTTGTPKGAPRPKMSGIDSAQFFDRIPLRTGQRSFVAAPLFHGTGLAVFVLSLSLGCKIVLRRKFDPEATVRQIAEHRCTTLVVVPTMLQRIVDLGPEVLRKYDTSSLEIIFAAGSAVSPDLGNRAMDAFGDVLYNFYGSTEIACLSVATPSDWRQAPGTAGRAPVGCRLALYDEQGNKITEPHVTGRIFGGSGLAFEGYTDGRHKERIDGLLSSGDVGHFDENGLLFVDGRDDEMIVSGGENVFPVEVENLIAERSDVVEAAVIGVPDEEFGQRLKAFVVRAEGAEFNDDDVKGYVKSNLARYKTPREVVFLDELPRNATGKLLRNKLTDYD
ncbi:MAG: AMP-binding protein [Pseudonocardiaceae bacterium]|nr:AMP-binding protein [Pseudonocardiaceae bacterium]